MWQPQKNKTKLYDRSTLNLRDDDSDSSCDRRRNRRTESLGFKSPSVSSAHKNHKGRGEGEAGSGWVFVWGGKVDDGRGPCATARAIYRGPTVEMRLIDVLAKTWFYLNLVIYSCSSAHFPLVFVFSKYLVKPYPVNRPDFVFWCCSITPGLTIRLQ